MAQYLYDQIEAAKNFAAYKELPGYVRMGLNPAMELRPYQELAFRNYITYYETPILRAKTPQVLFHMATGSGKTLIMAGLILYLYQQGYRNFLFFVNRNIIIRKTKDNFLNVASSKYQFNPELIVDGKRLVINEVDNFDASIPDAVNICFITIQKLHADLFDSRENSITIEDLKRHRMVMISDEAHHLNAATLSKERKEENRQWETTINNILKSNAENLLLEFTATCKFESNPLLQNKYEEKVVFDYALSRFREDGYSKDIECLAFGDSTPIDRALIAVVMSQMRLKLFQKYGQDIKPIVMFKSKTIAESKAFMNSFVAEIDKLDEARLSRLFVSFMHRTTGFALEYFRERGITLASLAAEIQDEFGRIHCISANEEKDADRNQILLNTLEDRNNPYRAVFAVDKLNEGWDVLNLFDIVRVAESAGGAKDTNAEAQLIGRGARYCPFQLNAEQNRFTRKFDHDVLNPMRLCETLLYHCINESHYISKLNQALRESGIMANNVMQEELLVKPSFKETAFYDECLVFVNQRREKSRSYVHSLPDTVKTERQYQILTGHSSYLTLMEEYLSDEPTLMATHTSRFTIKEIGAINYNILHRAMRQQPALSFNSLLRHFPNLHSSREFLLSDDYLGNISIAITSKFKKEQITTEILCTAAQMLMKEIAVYVSGITIEYYGTKEFFGKQLKEVIHDRIMNFTNPRGDGYGISQKSMNVAADIRLDLSKEDWYVFNDNFGTPEEKAFVALFKKYVDDLQQKYDRVYLVRNEQEKELVTYSFENGRCYEPDFILFLFKEHSNRKNEQIQIFIEPKGDGFIKEDSWKEDFLLEIEKEGIPVIQFVDNNDYRIRGFHFFNRNYRSVEFENDMKSIC